MSKLGPGSSVIYDGITSETVIDLSNFSLEDGIFIEVNAGRGVSRDASSDSLFKRQNGTFIPVPDLSGIANFTGAALGIVSDTVSINIHRVLNLDTDYVIDTITEPKYQDRSGLAEEFYYISFLDPKWSSLDKRDVVLLITGAPGARGFSIVQTGFLHSSQDGVLDFTKQAFTGFGVNMYCVYSADNRNMVEKLSILNPIDVNAMGQALDYINVIRVNAQLSGSYKVVVTITGVNKSEVVRNIATDYSNLNLNPRYTDGIPMESAVFPEYDPENGIITYHLGSVDRDMMFNLVFDGVEGFNPANATVSLQPDNEGIVVRNLDDMLDAQDSFIIRAGAERLVTWAYHTDHDLSLDIKMLNFEFDGFLYFHSPTGAGTRGVFDNSIDIKANSSGYFILWNENLEPGTDMLKIGKKNHQTISCSVVEWDPEHRDYVCVDDACPECIARGEKKHYSFDFIEFNKDIIFKDQYWTSGEFGRYGKIGYSKGHNISCTGLSVSLTSSTTGNIRNTDPYGTYTWNPNETSQKVEVRVKRIYTTLNKIVCDIAIDGSDSFTRDVEMTPAHVNHTWEYTGGEGNVTARCTSDGCEEVRNAIHLSVGPGGPYTIITNGTVDLSVPAMDNYYVVCDTLFRTPSLPITADVYFIAPTSGYHLSYTADGYVYCVTLHED